jgi:hypothetical protein
VPLIAEAVALNVVAEVSYDNGNQADTMGSEMMAVAVVIVAVDVDDAENAVEAVVLLEVYCSMIVAVAVAVVDVMVAAVDNLSSSWETAKELVDAEMAAYSGRVKAVEAARVFR